MGLSLPAANFWFNASNVALCVGAFIIAVGTYGVYKTGAIKERFADERTSANEKETALAKERAASLEVEGQKIRQRLEEERLSRLKLQNALSSRHLSPEDSDRLSDMVRGRLNEVVVQVTSDAESLAFAQDISNALIRGGVKVIPELSGILSPKPYGISVASADPSPLTDGLRAAHVAFQIQPAQPAQPAQAWILVGEKPPAL